MKINFLAAGLIYLAIVCLLLFVGCNPFHTAYFGVEDQALTAPKEFHETQVVIEKAKETADSLYAEKKIDEAMDLGREAAETYWACYDQIAKDILALARQAAYRAELYHPQPPPPPMKREPAISRPLEPPESLAADTPFSGFKALPPRMVLETFYFDFDSDILKPGAKPFLDRQTAFIRNHSGFVFEVAGHTDSVGPDAYNQGLSTRRAKSVGSYITSVGVRKRRLYIAGYGESQPIATNLTDEGRAKNRRSEIRVLGSLLPGFALENIESLPAGTTIEVVNFNFNQYELQPVYEALLDKTVEALKKNPRVRLELAGYSDRFGGSRANRSISLRRATSVRNYLISRGISKSRLKSRVYAEAQPIASNRSSIGRQLNRRVEIRIAP